MYYDASPSGCGSYDTENFLAADACCACGGGSTTGYGGWGMGGQYGVGWTSGGGVDEEPPISVPPMEPEVVEPVGATIEEETPVEEPIIEEPVEEPEPVEEAPIEEPEPEVVPVAESPVEEPEPVEEEEVDEGESGELDESCCDCSCEAGAEPEPVIPICLDFEILNADKTACITPTCGPNQILTPAANCTDCAAYSYPDEEARECIADDCTDMVAYINGTCGACGEFTFVNEDQTECISETCVEGEILLEDGTCDACGEYTHPDTAVRTCIADVCNNSTEYLTK